jgi:hypothetical protein
VSITEQAEAADSGELPAFGGDGMEVVIRRADLSLVRIQQYQ